MHPLHLNLETAHNLKEIMMNKAIKALVAGAALVVSTYALAEGGGRGVGSGGTQGQSEGRQDAAGHGSH